MTTNPDKSVPPDPWTHLLQTPIPIPTIEKHWDWISALKAADAEVKRLRGVILSAASEVVERKPPTTNRTRAGNATVCAHLRMHPIPVRDGARCFQCDDCGLLFDAPGQVL